MKSSTIGLVRLDEMRAIQEDLAKEREKQLAQKNRIEQQKEDEEKKKAKEEQKKRIQTLSFKFDEEEEEEEEEFVPTKKSTVTQDGNDEKSDNKEETAGDAKEEEEEGKRSSSSKHDIPIKKMKITKNPDVDTSFLPDRNREEEERHLREELRLEWVQKTEKMKNEDVEITFSYWDGSGHRRSVVNSFLITLNCN